ncbi:unnamed protein product [Prunus brigantina]
MRWQPWEAATMRFQRGFHCNTMRWARRGGVTLCTSSCSNKVPFGVMMTTPTPAPFWFDALSTLNCHMSLGWPSSAEIRAELKAELGTARYTNKSSLGTGLVEDHNTFEVFQMALWIGIPFEMRERRQVNLLGCPACGANWEIKLARIPSQVIVVGWFLNELVSVGSCVCHAVVHRLVPLMGPAENGYFFATQERGHWTVGPTSRAH